MATRLIIDGNSVYEIDEECERGKRNNVAGNRKNSRGRGWEISSMKEAGMRKENPDSENVDSSDS